MHIFKRVVFQLARQRSISVKTLRAALAAIFSSCVSRFEQLALREEKQLSVLVIRQGKTPLVVRYFAEVSSGLLVAGLHFFHFLLKFIRDIGRYPLLVWVVDFYFEHLELALPLKPMEIALEGWGAQTEL